MTNQEFLNNVPNFHVIKVTYLSVTETKGSRVSLKSERYTSRKIIDYNYTLNGTLEIAKDYIFKNGFNIIGTAEGKDCYYIITDTFKTL